MDKIKLKEIEHNFMLNLYLKRILTISSILTEFTQISDTEMVKKLKYSIELYLNELHKTKNIKWIEL